VECNTPRRLIKNDLNRKQKALSRDGDGETERLIWPGEIEWSEGKRERPSSLALGFLGKTEKRTRNNAVLGQRE